MASTSILEVAQHVLDCMCAALTETAAEIDGQPGCPCRTGIVPGQSPIICCPDHCGPGETEPGQLTVHLARTWLSSTFPQQDTGDESCKAPPKTLVGEFVVTLVRCVPIVDAKNGDLPSMEKQARAAEVGLIDWQTLQTAARCCVPTIPASTNRTRKVGVLDHRAIGPTGPNGPTGLGAKCAGSELHLAVDIGAVCCPAGPS